jgi:hypothetical protein
MREILLASLLGFTLGRKSRRDTVPEEEPDSTDIEVGAIGSELPYWKAKEALRQGEAAIKIQTATVASIVAQATTMLGWVLTAATAAVSVAVGSDHTEWRAATIVIACGLVTTAGICGYILLPRFLYKEALEPLQILDSILPSELKNIEAIAIGHDRGLKENQRILIRLRTFLIGAWLIFGLTPFLGAATLVWVGLENPKAAVAEKSK